METCLLKAFTELLFFFTFYQVTIFVMEYIYQTFPDLNQSQSRDLKITFLIYYQLLSTIPYLSRSIAD